MRTYNVSLLYWYVSEADNNFDGQVPLPQPQPATEETANIVLFLHISFACMPNWSYIIWI
jgi:hypothetical protein